MNFFMSKGTTQAMAEAVVNVVLNEELKANKGFHINTIKYIDHLLIQFNLILSVIGQPCAQFFGFKIFLKPKIFLFQKFDKFFFYSTFF